MIYREMVFINGYIIITLCIRVTSLRGQVGNGPRVQDGRWASSRVTFTVCLLEFILLLVGMVNVRGSSVKGLIADLFMNITFLIVRAQVGIVNFSRRRF